MKSEQLIRDFSAKNFTSTYGQLALSTFQNYRNRSATSFIANTNLLSALIYEKSPLNLLESKPVANMLIEYEAIAVASNSRYSNMTQLINDLSINPKSVTFIGGPKNGFDYYFLKKLLVMQNIDPKSVNYVETNSGAQLIGLLNGDSSKVAISSNGNFVSGVNASKTRILGVASPERLNWLKGKTFISQNFNLVDGNRFGVIAPANLNSIDFDNLLRSLEILHNSKIWKKTILENYWSDDFLYSSQYQTLLEDQIADFAAMRS